MDIPSTVATALADRPVEGRHCLEAGAGLGNTTAGLLAAGAQRVYAVTNDRAHVTTVRERVPDERAVALEADLRALPLRDAAVSVVTAHGLCNVVPASDLATIAFELSRVAAPGAHLVVDDYAPLPADAAIRDLFAVENAAAELARGAPALTFYPADHLAAVFEAHGWTVDRRETLLDPVPWTESHVAAHLEAVESALEVVPDEIADPLLVRAERLAAEIGSESAGEMYSLALVRER